VPKMFLLRHPCVFTDLVSKAVYCQRSIPGNRELSNSIATPRRASNLQLFFLHLSTFSLSLSVSKPNTTHTQTYTGRVPQAEGRAPCTGAPSDPGLQRSSCERREDESCPTSFLQHTQNKGATQKKEEQCKQWAV